MLTARVLKRPDMRIGGKTGTAQVVKIRMVGERRAKTAEMEFLERDHAWIGSWGEKDGRKIVVVTMLEHGGGGSSAAGPVTKAVYDILFPAKKSRTPLPDSATEFCNRASAGKSLTFGAGTVSIENNFQ